jgi:NAD(P)-dependent dehydrogenase (short-subunit alcohol dehydrogenase family)
LTRQSNFFAKKMDARVKPGHDKNKGTLMYDLTGRVALVTGAGPNIGRAIAATLAHAGATVLCNDLKPAIAEASARSAAGNGGKAFPLPFDITDPDQVETAVEQASLHHGTIEILVNNAGVTVPKSILTMSIEEWRLVTRVIQDGAFHCSRAVAKRLVAAKKPGAIVNIASTTGHRGRKNAIAYATAKGGILNFTRALAMDLAPYKIRVNSVSPTKTGASVGAIESAGARNFDEIPLGRLGEPQDHANAVLFLVSDAAGFITGIDVRVDGGTLATWGTRSQADPTAAGQPA